LKINTYITKGNPFLTMSVEGIETIIINARGTHIEVPKYIVEQYFGIKVLGKELYVNYRAKEVHKVFDEIIALDDLPDLLTDEEKDSAKLKLSDILDTDEKGELKININFEKELFVCEFGETQDKMFKDNWNKTIPICIKSAIIRLNKTSKILYFDTQKNAQEVPTGYKVYGLSVVHDINFLSQHTIRELIVYILSNNLTALSDFYEF
jgi:hypothetical protein